jgi:hypothetical protein
MMPVVGTPLHANAHCERSATLFVKLTPLEDAKSSREHLRLFILAILLPTAI